MRSRVVRCRRCSYRGYQKDQYDWGFHTHRLGKTRQRTNEDVTRTHYAWECLDCLHVIWSVYER